MTNDQVVAWLRRVFDVDRNPTKPIPVPAPLMREFARRADPTWQRRRNNQLRRRAERREDAN